MISPITILEHRNINVNNPIKAVQDAKALNWRTPEQFCEGINELVGDAIDINKIDNKSVHYVYYYLVQNIVRQRNIGPIDMKSIIEQSLKDADKLTSRVHGGDLSCVLLLEEYATGENTNNVDLNGVIKPIKKRGRKGNKKNLAMNIYKENKDTLSRSQIVDMFVKNLEMSKACAQTYFSILKKELE